jgi:CheY-like chemotaxis protein
MEPLKALVVEDTRSMRKFMALGLEKAIKHIRIVEAQNGKEAQQLLMAGKFHCVICDHDMPLMSGEELLQWARNSREHKDIPFIMATATRERELLARFVSAGANACLLKPFTIDDLVHRVVDVTQLNRRQYERFAIEGTLIFSYRKMIAKAKIIDISKGGVFGLFKFSPDTVPAILEKVVVDIETVKGTCIKDIDAYVVRQQVEGDLPDISEIKIAARFHDLPQAKTMEIDKFFSLLQLN